MSVLNLNQILLMTGKFHWMRFFWLLFVKQKLFLILNRSCKNSAVHFLSLSNETQAATFFTVLKNNFFEEFTSIWHSSFSSCRIIILFTFNTKICGSSWSGWHSQMIVQVLSLGVNFYKCKCQVFTIIFIITKKIWRIMWWHLVRQ